MRVEIDMTREPMIDTCSDGHKYYREVGTFSPCPFCMKKELEQAGKPWREQALDYLIANRMYMNLVELNTIRKFINGKVENGTFVETIDTNINLDCKDLHDISSRVDNLLDMHLDEPPFYVTGAQLKLGMMASHINSVRCQRCGICEEFTCYTRVKESIYFNSSCGCASSIPTERTWDSVANWINNHDNEDRRRTLANRFGVNL